MQIHPGTCLTNRVRRGASATEFALLLPVLLGIVLGCVDFGRFAYTWIMVTNAARAGAGYGCVNRYSTATYGSWQAQVRQAAAAEMGATAGFDANDVTAVAIAESGGLWRAQVQVSCDYQTLVPWPGVPGTLTMSRTVEIRGIR